MSTYIFKFGSAVEVKVRAASTEDATRILQNKLVRASEMGIELPYYGDFDLVSAF